MGVAARVFQQRHQVVSNRARHRILEVEQAAGLDAFAAGNQQKIVDVVVEQDQRRGHLLGMGQ